MSIEEENKAVLRRWLDEMWIHGKFRELMPELAGPEYIRHHSNGTFTVTVEEYIDKCEQIFQKSKQTYNNVEFDYELMAEGDKVATIASYNMDGEKFLAVQVFRLSNGKLVETWCPEFMKATEIAPPQLGAIPSY